MLYLYMVLGVMSSAVLMYCNQWITRWYDILIFLILAIAFFVAWSLLHMVVLLLASVFMDKKKPIDKHSKFYEFVMVETLKMIFFFARVRITVEGKEKIPQDTRFLLVGNHRSNFDPMTGIVLFHKSNLAFISKPENFNIPIAGQFIHKSGFLALDRVNVKNALGTINRAANLVSAGEFSFGIFPEGTRNRTDEKLLEFKNGAFKIATKAKAPIVVMVMKNMEKVKKNFPFKGTHVYVKIVDVVPSEVTAQGRTAEISERVRSVMLENMD